MITEELCREDVSNYLLAFMFVLGYLTMNYFKNKSNKGENVNFNIEEGINHIEFNIENINHENIRMKLDFNRFDSYKNDFGEDCNFNNKDNRNLNLGLNLNKDEVQFLKS